MTTICDFGDQFVWRKSSKSNENGGACLYVAFDGDQVGVRDSKLGPEGPVIWFDQNTWASLAKAASR
ncbi:DUF397 domain-containing protein [Glycomyces sp. YM15]|uniref:DUF397 domain-containing protein n=1 Tax=Glycomyces sp. YM15 TaxID=2800446 RepID=UPI001963BEEA|nr:DUF397 domain-containing protein [Glycomyces sp. YM15]